MGALVAIVLIVTTAVWAVAALFDQGDEAVAHAPLTGDLIDLDSAVTIVLPIPDAAAPLPTADTGADFAVDADSDAAVAAADTIPPADEAGGTENVAPADPVEIETAGSMDAAGSISSAEEADTGGSETAAPGDLIEELETIETSGLASGPDAGASNEEADAGGSGTAAPGDLIEELETIEAVGPAGGPDAGLSNEAADAGGLETAAPGDLIEELETTETAGLTGGPDAVASSEEADAGGADGPAPGAAAGEIETAASSNAGSPGDADSAIEPSIDAAALPSADVAALGAGGDAPQSRAASIAGSAAIYAKPEMAPTGMASGIAEARVPPVSDEAVRLAALDVGEGAAADRRVEAVAPRAPGFVVMPEPGLDGAARAEGALAAVAPRAPDFVAAAPERALRTDQVVPEVEVDNAAPGPADARDDPLGELPALAAAEQALARERADARDGPAWAPQPPPARTDVVGAADGSADVDDTAAADLVAVKGEPDETPPSSSAGDEPSGGSDTSPLPGGSNLVAVRVAPPEESVRPTPSGPTLDSRIVIHFNESATEAKAQRIADALMEADFPQPELREVPFPIRSTNTRYFFDADRLDAAWVDLVVTTTLNVDSSPGPKDFTDYRPLPSEGTIEVWLPD